MKLTTLIVPFLLAFGIDSFGQTLSSVVNSYITVTAPATIASGGQSFTVSDATFFPAGTLALIIQMQGATVSTTAGANYGNVTAINNTGNYEYVKVASVSGNILTLQSCLKNSYTISGKVQLVSVPVYSGNQTVVNGGQISAIQVTGRGYGYTTAPTVSIAAPTGPLASRIQAAAVAVLDNLGQVRAIRITNAGGGYIVNPAVTLSTPPAPYNFTSYLATAISNRGLTALQWDGEKGGVLAFEVNGDLALSDSILMNGMGFAGGVLGTSGSTGFGAGCGSSDALSFGAYPPPAYSVNIEVSQSGTKGEGVAEYVTSNYRGRGRFGNGGGAGLRGEAGGGGGGNYGAGGQGGRQGSNAIFGCNSANGSGRSGFSLSSLGYGSAAQNRIFLGGGGGGGHAYNGTYSAANANNFGGYGGGIVIISANSITGNGRAIKANGGSCFRIVADGASGGGGGGVVILNCNAYTGSLIVQTQGGKGGNTDNMTPCTTCNREGPGGGGGGGVVWFSEPTLPTGVTSSVSGGTNGICLDNITDPIWGASPGIAGIVLYEYYLNKGLPISGSNFTIGSLSLIPRPDFPNLAAAMSAFATYGNVETAISVLIKNGTYTQPVSFKAMINGCVPSSGTVVVESESGNSADVILSTASDVVTVENHSGVTLKNLTISATATTNRAIFVTSTSDLNLERTEITGGLEVDQTGSNVAELINTNHQGNIEVEANATLHISKYSKIVGQAVSNRSLLLSSGSILNQTSGSVLELEGSNFTNNGASLGLNSFSSVRLTGSLNQILGGTAASAFRRLIVSGTGSVTVSQPITLKKWLQSSNRTISCAANTIGVSDSILVGPGTFVHSGSGTVQLLASGTGSAYIQGRFWNLSLENPLEHIALGNITVDNNLNLISTPLNMGSFLVFIENSGSAAVSVASTAWVNGGLRRRILPGTYSFPVGSDSKTESAILVINSLSGGLQYINVGFVSENPIAHPIASTFVQNLEGSSIYTGLAANGYWTINPDQGSADYELRLYPSTLPPIQPFSFYKRPNSSSVWALFGTLSNPEATADYVQADGSLRRSALSGFSDFAIAESDGIPLSIQFVEFEVKKDFNGNKLSWKLANCAKPANFEILKGLSIDQLQPIDLQIDRGIDCKTFFATDNQQKKGIYYYKIKAKSNNDVSFESKPKVIGDMSEMLKILPTQQPGIFRISLEEGADFTCQIFDMVGKKIYESTLKNSDIVDLSHSSKGVYTFKMQNGDKTFHHKILNGER